MSRLVALFALALAAAACHARSEDQAATTQTTGMGIGLPTTAATEGLTPPPPAPAAGYPEERRFFGGPAEAGGTTGKETSTSLDGTRGVGAGPAGMNDPAAADRALGAPSDASKEHATRRRH